MYKIAIDGPSGAGKSTVAKNIAKDFGITYVDTGALYRTIGLYVYNQGIASTDKNGVLGCLKDIHIELKYLDGKQMILLNGIDVKDTIRTQTISKYASDVSAFPEVRSFLLDTQRNIAKTNNIIMDGRDIGTVIFPDADVKIFLTTSPEKRALRRYNELKERGQDVVYETILKEINERDYNDSHRETAPLRQAEDAILVDNGDWEPEDTTREVSKIIKEKLGL